MGQQHWRRGRRRKRRRRGGKGKGEGGEGEKPDSRLCALTRKAHVMTQQEGCHPQARKRGLTKNCIYGHLDLGLPSPQNCEDYGSSLPMCDILLWQPAQTKTLGEPRWGVDSKGEQMDNRPPSTEQSGRLGLRKAIPFDHQGLFADLQKIIFGRMPERIQGCIGL